MTVKSYRRERSSEFHDAIKRRNIAAGVAVANACKDAAPAETGVLRASIKSVPTDDGVTIGTNLDYGKFVHNGTYDFNHRGPWSEAEAGELLAWKSAQVRRGGSTVVTPPKGLMPRPFLVFGVVQAKPALKAIYGAPIVGRG